MKVWWCVSENRYTWCMVHRSRFGIEVSGGLRGYRGTSLIRNSPPPQDDHRALGIVLLKGPRGAKGMHTTDPVRAFDPVGLMFLVTTRHNIKQPMYLNLRAKARIWS